MNLHEVGIYVNDGTGEGVRLSDEGCTLAALMMLHANRGAVRLEPRTFLARRADGSAAWLRKSRREFCVGTNDSGPGGAPQTCAIGCGECWDDLAKREGRPGPRRGWSK